MQHSTISLNQSTTHPHIFNQPSARIHMQHSAISLNQSTTHLLFLGRNACARFARIGAFSRRLTVLFALGCGALFSNMAQAQFISTWETTAADESITIPTASGSTYNYTIDCGTGGLISIMVATFPVTSQTAVGRTGDSTCNYAMAGEHEISITGTFPRISTGSATSKDNLISVEQWGTVGWTSMFDAFNRATNLTTVPNNTTGLESVRSMRSMFARATNLNSPMNRWTVSEITTMQTMFFEASSFNQDIGAWDVAMVENMDRMFIRAGDFNQDISAWDVSSVTDMNAMFDEATAFNQNLGEWYISGELAVADSTMAVGTITAQNAVLTAQLETTPYTLGGTDASLFGIANNGVVSLTGMAKTTGNYELEITANGADFGATPATRAYSFIVPATPSGELTQAQKGRLFATFRAAIVADAVSEGNAVGNRVSTFQATITQCETTTNTFIQCVDDIFTQLATANTNNLFVGDLTLDRADYDALVAAVNTAPTVVDNAIADQAARVGEAFDFTFDADTFSDPEGDGITYTAAPLPAGIAFDATSRTFSGMPTTAETITVTVTATDDGSPSLETSDEFNIVVAAANVLPTFASSNTVTVAENQTAVLTVMVTDGNIGDPIAYALTGGADQSSFDIVAATGVLTFKTAPDHENPTDVANADGAVAEDNIYQVTVEVCDGIPMIGQTFSCTNRLVPQTITITVTDVNEVIIGIADQSRSIAEDAAVNANVGDELTTTGDPTAFEITGGNTNDDFAIDNTGQITVAKALDFETTTSYPLMVRITKDDADPKPATITITVTDVNETKTIPALSQVTLVMNSQINANIDQRVNGIGDSDTVNFGGATLTNGADNSAALPTWLSQHGEDLVAGEVNMKSLLANSSFEMSLSAKQTASGQSSSAIWGRGNYRLIEDSSGVSYDGGVFGFTVGVDTPLGERGLGGVALSWNDSKVDYEGGEYQLGLVSVHPYFGWHEDAAKMWVRLGYGVGSLEVTPNSGAKQDSDVSMQSLAGGGSGRITQTADGATELRGKGEVSIARLEVDDSDVSTATGIDVGQVRLALEATHTRELRGGASLQPSAEIGIRYDSGDGENEGKNTGIALRAGVKRIGGRLTLEGNVHGLFARGDYKEWGVDGMVSMNPGRDGQGLSFTVAPGLGDTTSEVERLWQQDLRHSVPTSADDADDIAPRLRATVGYGLTHRWQPYGEMTLANNNNRYGLGVRWNVKQAHGVGFHLNLLGEHRDTDTATNAILLQGKVEF